MDWITLTESDLIVVMSGAELEVVRAAALQEKQADPIASTLTLATDTVRGAIAGHRLNRLGAEGTIPPSLKAAALDWAVWKIMLRTSRVNDPAGLRKEAFAAACELFDRVAEGKRTIEAPSVEVSVERCGPTGIYGGNTKVEL